ALMKHHTSHSSSSSALAALPVASVLPRAWGACFQFPARNIDPLIELLPLTPISRSPQGSTGARTSPMTYERPFPPFCVLIFDMHDKRMSIAPTALFAGFGPYNHLSGRSRPR